MKNDSQLIAGMFHELRQFCRDVSLLLCSGEEIFKQRGWQSEQADKTCLYAGSYSLDWPDYWLPLRFFRCFGNPRHDHFLSYIAVVIDLPEGLEREVGTTFLTAGGLKYETAKAWGRGPTGESTHLFLWHLLREDRDDTGSLSWHSAPFAWAEDRLFKNWKRAFSKVDEAVTMAMPLHEITSAADLESRIIAPLLNEITDHSKAEDV